MSVDDMAPAVPGDDFEDLGAQAAAPASSVVDRIRKRHETRSRTLDLAIPQWDGDVVVRYGRLPKKSIIDAGRRKGNASLSNAKLLVDACQEVFVRDDDGRLRPAREADGGPGPIRFDGRLADLFGIRADTPADVVLRMYADDIAVGAHAKRLYDWQTGADLDELEPEEVDELAGEADAAT